MSESSESDDGPANWTRQRRGTGKNSRKIVMRIEFDDSDESSSGSETASDEEPIIRPSGSGRRRQGGGGKRLISSDDDDSSSGSEITRTVVVRGRNKRKAVIVDEDPPAVDEPGTSGATASSSEAPPLQPSSSSIARAEDGFASDSSNDDMEKCPICLLSLRNQEIGKPSVCDHLFCAICIEEWSRNVRTCPIDRRDFDSIVVHESINNRKFVREIKVQGAEKADFETEVGDVVDEEEAQLDLEHCQICHHPDREDVMLLCDGCNRGFHMDCLTPALTEIPASFWYCDDCFMSEEEDLQEEMHVLMEDLREMGVPEQRLRVREVHQPRIPRTRQSERIRASIVARTRRTSTRITSDMDFSQPSSSRQQATAATAASASSSSTRKRPARRRGTRRRRAGRKRRTYVVEYDVDNYDQKFELETTKKVVRKRKSSKRTSRRKSRKTTARTSGTHKRKAQINDFLAQRTARENTSFLPQPRFSLFGSSADLEYFSDASDGDEIVLGGGDSEVGSGGTAIQTSIRIHSFSSSGRSLARRKGIIRELDQPRQPDILSSILDMQDRFHSATQHNRISAVTIAPDGTLKLPEKKEPSSEKKPDSNQNVAPSDVNQAPMYPRGGGGNNYNNNSGGGGGGYNNRFNNQSNYRNSTGGGGGGGTGGQFRSGNFSGGNNSGGNSGGGFLFNAFRRDSNNFQSDNGFPPNRPNNPDNNAPNRGRFRQNPNQQQRRNPNNQNRYSGPPSLGIDNNINCNPVDTSPSPFNIANLTSRPPPLFGIGSGSMFATPTKLPDSAPPVQTTPLNMSNNSRNVNNFSIPLLQRPPPPILPVYGPMNITGPDPPPPSTPEDLSRTAGPVAPIGPVAPLAPPPWNQNLFRLTSDYADSNDEDDDDSNCPNFSVYSAESFQVARSGENIAAAKATSSAEGGNADSDSVRQEDEYEENEEDLVQLGDDDDIPDALEKGKLNNSNESQSEAANTVPESEIYEPEFPTVEAPDDDEESPDASKEDDEEDRSQKAEDDEKDEDDSETENKVEDDDDGNVHDDESPEGESHDAECSDEDEEDKVVATAEKDSRKKKAGELGLYDDSDYEDIVDQPEFIPMPQDEPSIVASTKTDSGENEENYTPEIDRSDDLEKEGKCSPVEEEGTPSEAHEISRRTPDEEGHTPDEEGHTPDEEGHTPDEERHTPDEEGRTPELDDAKLQELAKKKQTDSLSEEEEEPERSYTPCLDEKEHEEANGESREQNTSRSDDRADDSLNVSTNVIDGMEMELISEEDEEMLNDDPNKASRGNDRGNRRDDGGGKRSRKEQFKKISKNTKERNYRDKENRTRPRRRGSKSRSRSRSHSKGKENRHRQRPPPRRTRRKEIERYNVRNVINQPRSFKDRYGRDTSRPARSRSRSRSRSIRRLRSKSRSRSFSPNKDRRSFSMSPTPISAGRPSPRRMSPRRFSPARRMSPRRRFSPRRSRSRSRSRRRSRSLRRTSLPRRRSRTPVRQRSRSMSPGRPNNRRNPRVRRQPSPRPVSRSFSHSVSKFGSRSRSPPPKSPRRSRSGSPFRFKNKRKRSKDRKRKRGKKRTMSMSRSPPPKRATHSVDAPVRKKKKRVRSKSPLLENERWSQSPEHLPEAGMLSSQPNDSSWTPPLVGANSDNLTVILKNKNAVNGAGKKKRDKKKKIEKRRDVAGRKERRRQRSEMRESPAAPSKEVFASGNNILVSVSFNKDNPVPQQQTTVVTLPPTREEIMSKRRSAERQPRRTKKSKDKIQRRRKKVDAKPVAIIDLDRSPFQIIQSPRDIIVLTDESDREGDGEGGNKRKNSNTGLEMNVNDRVHDEMQMNSIDKTVDMQRPNQMEEDEQFELQQLGPKTPPDPPTIKFSLAKTKQIKARNPLHDEQEELLQEQAEPEHPDDQMSLHAANKIGPNTPPESGPCSPDAYDPFDPTKSPSMSPSHSPPPPPDSAAEGSPEKIAHSQESNAVEQRPATMPQDKNMNPVDLVMALINTKSSMSQQEMLNKNSDAAGYQMKPDGTDSLNMAGEENLPSKNITVLSNVLISSGKSQNRNNPMLNTSPPIAKLPVAKQSTSRQNGGAGVSNDDIGGGASNEQESPYSPGSADYDDLFEPPPASAENTISLAQLAHNRKNKQDMFDNLFGSTSPGARVKNLRRKAARNIKKAIKVAKTKLEDDQVKIFDELPSSAVELQVKDKFLRKLNRQERVVEEVKLVLKPHYNRKRITKDDYKEILRRAVPKVSIAQHHKQMSLSYYPIEVMV